MKKTTRTYTRRMLAVVMSILMLMTSWVFVAPTASATTTSLALLPGNGQSAYSGHDDISGYYQITSNTTIQATGNTKNGLCLRGSTALIYVPQGVTLTVKGSNASGKTPGWAGIYSTNSGTLYITGPGKLVVTGGNGGNGSGGSGGGSPTGGAGGAGGGGGGAGIGTDGASGGDGGASQGSSDSNGNGGSTGGSSSAAGTVYILDSMPSGNITRNAGSNSSTGGSGGGGTSGSYTNRGGGGGGGGGSGYGGAAIGAGGPGGGGGGSGASGDWGRDIAGNKGRGGSGGTGATNGTKGTDSGSRNTGGSGGGKGTAGNAGTLSLREKTVFTAPDYAKGQVTYHFPAGTISGLSSTATSNTAYQTIGYPMQSKDTKASGNPDIKYQPTLPRTGYDYRGYYTTEGETGGTQYYDKNGNSAHVFDYQALDLYARWIPTRIHATLNLNIGDGEQPVTNAGTENVYHKYGAATYYTTDAYSTSNTMSKITVPTRIGYTFGGYYGNAACTGTQYINSSGNFTSSYKTSFVNDGDTWVQNKSVTLYAKWTPSNVKVTYLNNDGTVVKQTVNGTEKEFKNLVGKYDKKAGDVSTAVAPDTSPEKLPYIHAPGVDNGGTFNYVFDHWEIVEANQFTTPNSSAQADYADILGKDYEVQPLKGDTTFKAIYRIDSYIDYTITYKNDTETTTGTFHYKDDGYKAVILPGTTAVQGQENLCADNIYTYKFLGWAVQVDSNDTVYYQDWNEDAGAYVPLNAAQTPLTDYKVYRNRTWVAVYGRKYIDYQVTFNFVGVSIDPDTGAKVYSAANQVVYTKHYDQSFELPEALSYTGGKLSGTAPAGASYSNATGYTYNFSAWSPALSGTAGAQTAISSISGFTDSNANLKTKTFNATYTRVAATYTIKFTAPDTMTGEDGKEYAQYDEVDGTLKTIVLNPDNTQFDHGTSVASIEAAANPNKTSTNGAVAKAVKVYRDDQYEYTFTGWTPAFPQNGTPNDNVTYAATYSQAEIYTVTYADESGEVTTWRGTTAENIPALPNGIAAPTKEDDAYAKNYVFSGWDTTEYDAAHPVTPAIAADGTRNMTVPEGGTTVYAQFTREPIIYTINFIYGTPAAGSDVMPDHEQNLEYGQAVAIPSGDTVARADDDTYHYTFRGWDTTPSETVDGNATYTALYRKSYVYYDAIWYQPDLTATQQTMTVGDETWVYYAPTTETVREETYIYNALISAPYQSPNKPASSDPNQAYVLAGWLYKDTLGNTTPTLLDRGDRMTVNEHLVASPKTDRAGQIELVPVFVLKANIKTVTFYDDDGTLLGEQDVAYGTLIADIEVGTPSKPSTETEHIAFAGWKLMDGTTAAPETVTEDIELKASYTSEAHTWVLAEKDIAVAPTFLEKGQGEAECPTCHRRELVQIDELVDNRVPEGRVTVKNGAWEEIADDEDEVAAGAQNLFMVNTIDKTFTGENPNAAATKTVYKLDDDGELTENTISVALPAFDTENAGSGTKEIYICTKTATADPTAIAAADWYQVFDYEEYIVLNPNATEANFSALLGSVAENDNVEIADGETFWVYVKMVDQCGNTSYISTAPLVYDKTAPEITITSTDGRTGIKHCVDATIAVSSPDWFNITKNGTEAVDLPFDRTLREPGEYTIIAEDEAGNTTTQVVQIIGSHSPKTVVIPATCTVDGQRYDVCRFCGQTISEVETTAAPGHDLKIKIKQPTCVNNGTVTITCRNCSDVNEVYHETADLIANGYEELVATGEHTFDEGVVVKAATCSATGLKRFSCTVCDYYEDRELPINENAHLWSRPITVPATCTEEGMVYRECRYNSTHEKNVIEILPPTGHVAADDWTITQNPTCTEQGLRVKYCKYGCVEEGEPVIVETEEIPALGHELVIDHVVEPTATEQGYTVYKCTRCDYTENGNYVDPLARYTVTFIVGDNSEPIERALGETITSAMLTISTDKASDDEYKYTFDCWKKAVKNADDEWVATDTTVKMPITVSEDMAVIATYKSSLINYRIDFLYDNGESYKIKGYEHWNNVVTVEDPTKDPTATETYTFAGWKKAEKNSDDVWVATGDFVEEIVCKGDATYIAVFDATPITYTVIWADRAEGTYTALKTLTVAGGTDVTSENPALTGITLKTPNQNGHWVATGWDKQEEAANVTSDLVIRPIQEQVAHSYTTTTAAVSCTEPAKTIYTCACGYSYETTTGRPLGHNYSIEVSRVNPTADADGYKIMKCSRCGDQTNVTLPRIFLKITVKDNNHNAVSGVTVKVYDGDTYIGSGVSDSNGVATILVPEAKTYRIVIEGKEGSVTVNENGKITNSSIPTVDRDNGGNGGGNSGCDCTCHKSGFWPMIFRFFHKIIKLLTGEFRCCPDANY